MFFIKQIACPIEISNIDVLPPTHKDGKPQLTMSFKNNSDLIVTGLELKIKCFDKNNNFLGELSSDQETNSGLTVIVSHSNPNEVITLNKNYPLLIDTTRVEAQISYVMFDDDTDWDINARKLLIKERLSRFSWIFVACIIIVASIAFVGTYYYNSNVIKATALNNAINLIKEKKVYEAKSKLELLQNYKLAQDVLRSISGSFIISDNQIYYIDLTKGSSLYSFNYDKTEKEISSDNVYAFVLKDNYIYYINKGDDIGIFKISTTGTERTKLCNDDSDEIMVLGNNIIFTNSNDDHRIYKINLDGSNKIALNNAYSASISPLGNNIIYSNRNDFSKIYSLSVDGASNKLICEYTTTSLKTYQDSIYFTNEKDNNKVYTIKADGTGLTKISSSPSSDIKIINDKIYFLNDVDNKHYTITANSEVVPIK